MHKPINPARKKNNSHLFSNNQRLLYSHPLLLSNDEIKLDKYISDKSPDAKYFEEAILIKIKSLQELINPTIPAQLPSFKLKLSRSLDKGILVWAIISFDPKNEAIQRNAEQLMQQFVEPLQSLGARYGKSARAYLFLLPGFEKIESVTLTTTYEREVKLNWARASTQKFKSFGAIHIPPTRSIALQELTTDRANSNGNANILGAIKLPLQAFNNTAGESTLHAIAQLTTIEDDEERVLAANRLNLGKPVDAGRFLMSSDQSELVYYIFLEYVKSQQCPNTRYDQIEHDKCIHPSLRLDAEQTKKEVGCTSADIFIVCDLNPRIEPIVNKCIEAAERTIREGRAVFAENNTINVNGIYLLEGAGHQIKISLHYAENNATNTCASIN